MTEALIVVIVVVWLLAGWCGVVHVRRYFVERFGPSLGISAWDSGRELRGRGLVLTGPFVLVASLVCVFVFEMIDRREAPWPYGDKTAEALNQKSWFPL